MGQFLLSIKDKQKSGWAITHPARAAALLSPLVPPALIKSKGGWTGKFLTMVDDLYGPGGTKNQSLHYGRNFEGYFLVGHWLRIQ